MSPQSTVNFALADTTKLEVQTPALALTVGVAPKALGAPRPELNGLRVKVPGQEAVYLIDKGYRRWIPSPETYNNLFRDWSGVYEDLAIADIPLAAPITDGAVLAAGLGTTAIYLVDAGVKRWITTEAAMEKYHFNYGRVYNVPMILLLSIGTGPDLT
jgi:hypothetical protein